MQSEYISNADIHPLLQTIFPYTILHSYSETHLLIKVLCSDFINAPIQNWTHNRPPDMIRCSDIAQYITISNKPVEPVFFLSFNASKCKFDVLDGIHRYSALLLLHNHPIMQSTVIINIRFNATDEEIYGVFKSVNKSCPVSELYIRDTPKDKRDAVEALTTKWIERYKIHFSSSVKPQRPNTNRDKFMDLLSEIWDTHGLTQETAPRLEEIIQIENTRKADLHASISEKIRQKCEMSGCWLFI